MSAGNVVLGALFVVAIVVLLAVADWLTGDDQ